MNSVKILARLLSNTSSSSKPPKLTAKAAALAQRSFSLRLYKALLRSHKICLPVLMRELGDSYVREEFKRHKNASPEYLQSFFEQWLNYLQQMKQLHTNNHNNNNQININKIGNNLSPKQLQWLNNEQLQQLYQLKLETDKAAKAQVDNDNINSNNIQPVDVNNNNINKQ